MADERKYYGACPSCKYGNDTGSQESGLFTERKGGGLLEFVCGAGKECMTVKFANQLMQVEQDVSRARTTPLQY